MKPFLRWAGSKRQLLPILREYLPITSARYVEPFCGSACLFFDLEPKKALLGDINPELISTLRAVKRDALDVAENLKKLPRGKSAYYRIRDQDLTKPTDWNIDSVPWATLIGIRSGVDAPTNVSGFFWPRESFGCEASH
jgi:site-specific DNA-adenine methylase